MQLKVRLLDMIDVQDKILTWHPEGKKGTYISRSDYVTLREFICSAVRKQEISITELIDLGQKALADKIGNNISWEIWVVKLDLEARGLLTLKSKTIPYSSQYLKLKPGALKKIRAYSDME
ncbi:MAG: hypothetical protein ABIS36_17365 [Chryseolinea sp.]